MIGVAQESTIPSGMIDVVDDGSEEADGLVEWIEQCLETIGHEEARRGLHHISCMRRIVIWIVVIIRFDHSEPIAQCALVTAQCLAYVETVQNGEAEPH